MCTCRLLPWSDPAKVRTHQRACAVMAKLHGLTLANGTEKYPWTPNRRGHVRWLGVDWIGVPAPVRWWMVEVRGVELSGPLEGCGCCRRLRGWWYARAWRRAGRIVGRPDWLRQT